MIVLLAGFGGAWRFEDRTVLYFDEIINAAKAEDGLIFDYSLRPVFFALNRLAWLFVGEDLDSLRLLAIACYVAAAYLVFRAGWGLAGRACAWAAFLAFAFSKLVLIEGIRGMPHLPAGLAVSLTLFLWVLSENRSSSPWRRWVYGVGAGCATVLAVGCHPTALPFSGALGLWALGAMIFGVSRTSGLRTLARTRHFGIMLGLGVSLVLLQTALMLAGQGSYLSAITRGVGVVQTEDRFAFNQEAWDFYLRQIADDPTLLTLISIAALGLGITLVLLIVGNRESVRPPGYAGPVTFLVGASLLWLGVLSALSWKFARVLVAYVPLLSLAGAYIAVMAFRSGPLLARRVLLAASLLALATAGWLSAVRVDETLRTAPHPQAHSLYEFSELLENLVSDGRVGYLGDRSSFTVVRRCALAADLSIRYINDPADDADSRRRSVERTLAQRGIEFMVLNFQQDGERGRASHPSWWEEGFAFTAMEEVYQYRNQFRLVRIVGRASEGEMERSLGSIPAGTQLAVLGQPQELDPARAVWLKELLLRHALRDYRLWLAKSPRLMFSYVQPKGLRYILLTGVEPKHEEHLDEFRELVVAAGGTRLAVETSSATELWELEP